MGTVKPGEDLKQELNDSGCVQDDAMEGYRGAAELLDLSDDVLVYLLSFCPPMELKALGHTCLRLARLICDRTLWQRVDARDCPMGSERLTWFLTHCLSASTAELALTGYANTRSRCLGIQDLGMSSNPEAGSPRPRRYPADAAEMDYILEMWYPHLPRYAVTPRWPDKEEAARHLRVQSFRENGVPSEVKIDGPVYLPQYVPVSLDEGGPLEQEAPDSMDVNGNEPADSYMQGYRGLRVGSDPQDQGPGPSQGQKPWKGKGKRPILAYRTTKELRASESPHNCIGPHFTFSGRLMKDLVKKCPQLTSLLLEYCNIDYKVTNLRLFPPTLKKLSLRGTRCYNLPLNMSYLGKIHDQLPLLEYLDVSECEWFEPSSLMPLSKLPKLEKLYMRDCIRLTECVAYASLAARYGFRQLKVLDVRGSPISDSEVSAVGWLPLLEELYCAPGDCKSPLPEHTHAWSERLERFRELLDWEAEEPEYFRSKSPEPVSSDEEEPRLEPPLDSIADLGARPWWSQERRIIVITPTADADDNTPATVRLRNIGITVDRNDALQLRSPRPPPKHPRAAYHNDSAPPTFNSSGLVPSGLGPSGLKSGKKRANSDNGLDLIKRPRVDGDDDEDSDDDFDDKPAIIAQDCPRIQKLELMNSYINRGSPQFLPEENEEDEDFDNERAELEGVEVGVLNIDVEIPQAGPSGSVEIRLSVEPQARSSASVDPQAGPSVEPSAGPSVSAENKAGPSGNAESQPGPSAIVEPVPGPSASVNLENGPTVEPVPGPSVNAKPQNGPSVEPQNGASVEPQPGPSVSVGVQAGPSEEAQEPSVSVEPGTSAVSRVNAQTQAGESQLNVPDDKPAQDEPPSAFKPLNNGPRVNLKVSAPLPADAFPLRDPNAPPREEVEAPPPVRQNGNVPLIPVPPAPAHVHLINPVHFHDLNVPPHQILEQNLININDFQRHARHCAHAQAIVRGLRPRGAHGPHGPQVAQGPPAPAPQGPIEPPPVPHVYAPYPNGPQALIIPGAAAALNAGPQAHLLMNHNRLRNIGVYHSRHFNNQMPYVPPYVNVPPYRRNRRREGDAEAQVGNDGNAENADQNDPHSVRFRRDPEREHINIAEIPQYPNIHQSNSHLVTDSSILRFGRADNDIEINIIHIARVGEGGVSEQGNRPDRSNLRILSVTGYRNITNRSLQHLVTAAPHLELIDFSETSVTQNGVDMFKAIRPNCEVIFSPYTRKY